MSAAARSRPPVVAVVGAGTASADQEAWAHEVGRRLAEAGATVVCGGLGGVMAAACAGARAGGGTTIGILPGPDHDAANPYVDVVIPTGLGEARNLLVVRTAEAVVAVGGEYGTLSEIALACKVGLPVVGLGTWELHRQGRVDLGVRAVDSPAAAVAAALEAIGHRP